MQTDWPLRKGKIIFQHFTVFFEICRPNISPTTKRNRQKSSHSKKRKYSKHSLSQGLDTNQKNHDPWRDIYRQDLFEGSTSSSVKPSSSYHSTSEENSTENGYKGAQ